MTSQDQITVPEATATIGPPEQQTITSLDRFYNPNGQSAYRSMVESMIDSQPNIVYTIEGIAQDYPTISSDLLAGIVLSGQADKIPQKLLDEMAQKDIAAQEAAADQSWFGTFKGVVRGAFLGAEDLYNVSPLLAMSRLGINLYQGKSVDEATNLAFASSLRNEIRASSLGIETNYGHGFLPSQELVPQGAGFWTQVREAIINGEYEGSADEQMVAAQMAAMKTQILDTGFNPYALAREEWLSTQISRTINGENMAVPFSPGAAVALQYTTPGTFAYDAFSGSLDAVARVTLEPIDVAFDNVGQLFKRFNPAVFSDNVTGINRGGVTWQEVLADYDIFHATQPMLQPTRVIDDAGHLVKNPILGATDTRGISAEGVAKVTVDPHEQLRIWEQGIDDLSTKSGTEWSDLSNEYARAFHELGLTPNDVRRELSLQGGENGQYFLTLEHELVHGETHQSWYVLLDEFADDGTKYIDHAVIKPDAPEELQRIAREMQERNLSIADDHARRTAIREAEEVAEAIDDNVVDLLDQLRGGVADKARRTSLEREVADLQKASKAAHTKVDDLAAFQSELVAERNLLDAQANAFIEIDAVQTSWRRMKDGDWAAPKLYAEWKRKAGLSKLLRPWMNPKAATEWLQSNMGRRTVERLAQTNEFEKVRKYAGYLSPEEMARVTRSVDEGEVAEIIRKAINRQPGELRPTVGLIQDQLAYGLDGLRVKSTFIGGPVAAAYKQGGYSLRRAKAGVRANTLSVGDMPATLDTIYSVGATAGASADEISNLQIKAALMGENGMTKTGLDEIYDELKEISLRELRQRAGDVYSEDEIVKIWKEWEGYESQSRLFWTSNKGRERKVVFRNGKYEKLSNMDETTISGQAFMEAQFALSHRTMPDIRRLRRLHSKQRNAWERVRARRQTLPGADGYYTPLGFNKSALMGVGDFSFGIWRDMQLMRGGWALRIIPEEQLRFGASGYSGLFKNPMDYFISLMNRMDFQQPGTTMTLGDIMRMEETLGTAGLRDLRMPAHVVPHEDWRMASFARQPELAWAAFTREFLLNSHDRVVTRVARTGREEAIAFFLHTAEGKQIVREIAQSASKESSLGLVANPQELISMIDVIELRIAQITGGEGIWFDPLKKAYVDLNDVVIHPIPDVPGGMYPNKDTIKAEIFDRTGNPDALKGRSNATRGELKALLNEVRGYDLDELEKAKRAAFVTKEGDAEIRAFIHTRKLDDMVITDDMPFGAVRELDAQLEAAFTNRGVSTPEHWPVPANEMEEGTSGIYNKAVDTFFEWFNAVPSKTLNRQPFFNQAYGARLAVDYFYGTSEFRQAIDIKAASNSDFADTFAVGQRKVFRDKGVTKNPPPFEKVDDYEWDPVRQLGEPDASGMYDEAFESGRYDRTPLAGDPEAFVSQAFFDALEQLSVEADGVKARGTYTTTSQFWPSNDPTDSAFTAYPGLLFNASDRLPAAEWLGTNFRFNQWEITNTLLIQGTGKAADTGDRLKLLLWFEAHADEAITRSNLINVGVSPAAVDDMFADADVMARLNDMKIVTAASGGTEFSDEVLEAAQRLGWRGPMRTGGLAQNPARAESYGSYVDVFRTDHLPDYVTQHVAGEGDIEQLFTLEGGRFPALAKVDGFPEAFRQVRQETGLFGRTQKQTGTVADIQIRGHRAIRKRIESILGHELDNAATMEFERLWSSNARQWKTTVGMSGIDPAARLPTDLAASLRDHGLMVSSNRQVGDVALLFDTWLEPMAQQYLPVRSFTTEHVIATMPTIDDYSSAAGFDRWVGYIGQYDEPFVSNSVMRDDLADILESELPGRFYKNGPDGPELGYDVTSWVMSGKYRSVANSAHDQMLITESSVESFLQPFKDGSTQGVYAPISSQTVEANRALFEQVVLMEMWEQAIMEGQSWTTLNIGKWYVDPSDPISQSFADEVDELMFATVDRPATLGGRIEKTVRFTDMALQDMDEMGELALALLRARRGMANPASSADGYKLAGYRPKQSTLDYLNGKQADSITIDNVHYTTTELDDAVEKARLVIGPERSTPLTDEAAQGRGFASLDEYNELYDEWWNGDITSSEFSRRAGYTEEEIGAYAEYSRLVTAQRKLEYHESSKWHDPTDPEFIRSKPISRPEDPEMGIVLASNEPMPRNLELDTTHVPNDERNETVQRIFGRIDSQQYDRGAELGPVKGHPDVPLTVQEELEASMKAAKFEAIEETKQVFYDLANKSNIADAYKFIFPFGDAWYEVLSRWANIMDPVKHGGQPLRNVRRVQQTFNAGRQSGYISTNEYGEEVFNWPVAPGMMSNMFIPNSSNVHLQSTMPISSLMFIDPSARGVGVPGTSPIWQLSVQFTAPYTEGIPLLHDTLQWLTYGDKSKYRPGEIDELDDVMTGFVPTVMNRMAAWMFDEQAREVLGTTKLRLFQSLGMSGDPNYDFMTQDGGRRAWDTANAAGTWLAWFRIMDAWMMPGQPQYSVEFDQQDPLAQIPDMTPEEFLDQVGRLDWKQQVPVLSAVRLASEYRHARKMFGDAEADLYMIQRHGILPAMLQSASSGLVERPVSWGGVEHVNDNPWLKDIAPFTLAGTVPADADDTFSSAAWNNLFSEFLEIEGVENKPIRTKRSPSEFIQAVQRSVGYDQLRYEQALFDRAVEALRNGYGENYASDPDYRWKKKNLDRILAGNKDSIYTEFSIVRGSNQGAVVGSVEGVTLRMMVDETIRLGQPGTRENAKFREEMPKLAEVAEMYSAWFMELEALSRRADEGTASAEWWINGESDTAEFLRKSLAEAAQRYYSELTDPDQIAYAKWLNDNLLDDLVREWEWIDRAFAPELESYPSVWKASTLSTAIPEVAP